MTRLAALIAVLTAIFVVMGCGGAEAPATYTDANQAIDVKVNQEFTIALDSNPTTGFQWQESHDTALLELIEGKYEPSEKAQEGTTGAGGTQLYRFKGLKQGETRINLVHKQPWVKEDPEPTVFTIKIK